MKFRILGIALLSSAACLLAPASSALADDRDGKGERFFSGPLLSRFLPGFGNQSSSLADQALPSRFALGYYTTGPLADEGDYGLTSSYLARYPGPPTTTGVASLGYGSYYGATRIDTNRLAPSGLSEHESLNYFAGQAQDQGLSLSLEAGMSHESLNAGLLYAYQSGYAGSSAATIGGSLPYPAYIFAPLGGPDQALEARGHEGRAVFLYLGYNLSQQLNLRGTLGVAKTNRGSDEKIPGLTEQSRRWGLDIAATYRLLDNLVYEAHLGYVSIDDAPPGAPPIPQLHGASDGAPLSSSGGQNPDAIYHIGSHIRMTF
ncbi:hypothetical protein [Desulfurivibrio sp. C05AmB]|jgi:hypothetical protein|uniref:hypothetical protein n=1 Tax=Desulfurivibrio sp. C05AmB TaxID=3374371 RepID=UPI00376EA893